MRFRDTSGGADVARKLSTLQEMKIGSAVEGGQVGEIELLFDAGKRRGYHRRAIIKRSRYRLIYIVVRIDCRRGRKSICSLSSSSPCTRLIRRFVVSYKGRRDISRREKRANVRLERDLALTWMLLKLSLAAERIITPINQSRLKLAEGKRRKKKEERERKRERKREGRGIDGSGVNSVAVAISKWREPRSN